MLLESVLSQWYEHRGAKATTAQSGCRISACTLVGESGCNFLLHVSDLACVLAKGGSHERRVRVLG